MKNLRAFNPIPLPHDTTAFTFFFKKEISQIPRHLGNFPDTQAFGKFPRYPGIWEIPQIPVGIWGWYIFKILEISQMTGYLGNFPDTQAFGKFPSYPDIWEISQIPGHLGNSPNAWVSWKFPVIWEISKILKIYHPPISVGIWEISQIPRQLENNKINIFHIVWSHPNWDLKLFWLCYRSRHLVRKNTIFLKKQETEYSLRNKSQFFNIYPQPNYVNSRYFKLWLFDITEVIIWNIKGLQHWVLKI